LYIVYVFANALHLYPLIWLALLPDGFWLSRVSEDSGSEGLESFIITLPARTTNHSNPHLLCPPATWENIAVFFIRNYIARAATVMLLAATPLLASIWICFGALLMPATGLGIRPSSICTGDKKGERNQNFSKQLLRELFVSAFDPTMDANAQSYFCQSKILFLLLPLRLLLLLIALLPIFIIFLPRRSNLQNCLPPSYFVSLLKVSQSFESFFPL